MMLKISKFGVFQFSYFFSYVRITYLCVEKKKVSSHPVSLILGQKIILLIELIKFKMIIIRQNEFEMNLKIIFKMEFKCNNFYY